jgi:F-type H+-transporting ATPase subunit b
LDAAPRKRGQQLTTVTSISERYRRALFAMLVVAALACVALPVSAMQDEAAAAQEHATEHESGTGEAEAHGWGATIAKTFNFLALAGLLVYFLKSPIVDHLNMRGQTIRKDLTDAASLRATAARQRADVRARLAALPAELDALRRRGEEELAAERVRMADATVREKQNVIDRTRREIDLQFRIAHRRLVEHTAELSMTLARRRIERDITPDDQARLIDQYSAGVHA